MSVGVGLDGVVILGVIPRCLLYLAPDDVALVGQRLYLVLRCCDLSAVLGGLGGIEFCICRLLCFVVLILLLKEIGRASCRERV